MDKKGFSSREAASRRALEELCGGRFLGRGIYPLDYENGGMDKHHPRIVKLLVPYRDRAIIRNPFTEAPNL